MNRKNLILGGVLILLISLAYVYQGPFQAWRASSGQPDNFLAGLKVDEINKIEISYNGATTTLEKVGDQWNINGLKGFYVKNEDAGTLLARLKEAVLAEVELVSENGEKKDDFSVGETGAHVTLWQGGTRLLGFTVGRLGSDYESTFIAESGSEKTYAVKVNLNTILARGEWYDRTIFSADRAAITKIRFQYPGREFTVEKNDDKWSGVQPSAFTVREEKIDPILDIMSSLTAVKIPEQTFAGTGLEKNSIIVQATGEGIDQTIMVGDQAEDGNYFVKRGDSDNIYLINAEQRNQLNKRAADLR